MIRAQCKKFSFTYKEGEIEAAVIKTEVYSFFGKAAHLVTGWSQPKEKLIKKYSNYFLYNSSLSKW